MLTPGLKAGNGGAGVNRAEVEQQLAATGARLWTADEIRALPIPAGAQPLPLPELRELLKGSGLSDAILVDRE